MPELDPRIDDYIAAAADFAQPILRELRARLHAACPDLRETMKWSAPAFEYHGPLAGMAAFRAHCAFGFWRHELVFGEAANKTEGMGSFGRITKLSELPNKREFKALVLKAMACNEQGLKGGAKRRSKRPESAVHPEFARALAANAVAQRNFDAFPPSHRREYSEWIQEAKREETRARRIAQAIEWIAAGKDKNWKYR